MHMDGFSESNNIASSSNLTSYRGYLPQNPPAYASHLPVHHNQWQSMMPAQLPRQPQQQQQYNPSMWQNQNQIQHQSFSNHAPSIPNGFNFNPRQIQDALAMLAPVVEADEPVLIQALVDSRRRNVTYKDALNGLHLVKGHNASLWKDYYLEHKDRLDERVNEFIHPQKLPVKTIKKPSLSTFKAEPSPPRALSPVTPVERRKSSVKPPPLPRPSQMSGSRRRTINSLTSHTPVFDDRLPAPNAEVKIPEPPSRSPSPSNVVIPHGRGNKFTPEDREYFLKFIAWRLKGDPDLTRNELCALLAEKAPHHTSQSWASYWSNHHDIPDKILAAARGDEYESDEGSESGEDKIVINKRPRYRESSSENDSDSVQNNEDDDDVSDDDDDENMKTWSPHEMGPKGGPFTDADLYITAEYVATFSNFKEVATKDKWGSYNARFPQRSAKAWAEYYRRNEHAIDKLARKMKLRNAGQQSRSTRPQQGRPTWASSPDANNRKTKRKYDTDADADGDDDDGSADNEVVIHSKRTKGDH